jgi:hypothetical protein
MRHTSAKISACAFALYLLGGIGAARAESILVLTGSGASSLNGPLSAAGFTVVNGALAPGQIAANLTPDVVGVYIWNDGSLGNTGSPENPGLAFNLDDRAALLAFSAAHPYFIMDGLAWRRNAVPDEIALSQNEAIQLSNAGGGIVLGADDASGALIVQHVNQVASWFNFNPFAGVYSTVAANQRFGGSLFTSPHAVDPVGLTSSTTTYSEIPHGLQPNGTFLATALFGSPSSPTTGFGSPPLPGDNFGGVAYPNVNHLVTTNIPGGGIDNPVPEPASFLIFASGLFLFGLYRSRRGLLQNRRGFRSAFE